MNKLISREGLNDIINKVIGGDTNIDVVNVDIFHKAFSHKSLSITDNFIDEEDGCCSFSVRDLGSNERLEFLGDAVLELISTDFLYQKFSDLAEGELTAYRSALVNTNTLSEVAKSLDFNNYLFLSKGESKDFGRARVSILADTYESVIGAIFIDAGYDDAKKFVEKTLLIKTESIIEAGKYKDSKSKVQELSQEKLQVTPNYKVIEESGPDHNKKFIIGICFGDKEIAKGEGRSKQEAETDAAKNAIAKMK
jgi:ribonuclease-3